MTCLPLLLLTLLTRARLGRMSSFAESTLTSAGERIMDAARLGLVSISLCRFFH